MPQLKGAAIADKEVAQTDTVPFRQRLMNRFKSHEFVRVKNIDNETFEWQWFPSSGEEILADGDMRPVTGRRYFNKDYSLMLPGNEQFWALDPGETEVILGENAYLFIEGLYKRVVAKRAIKKTPKQDPNKARNFNWTDGNMQESVIDEIFMGVESPQFGNNEARNVQTAS